MNFAAIHTHNVHAGHDAVICIEPDDAMPAGDNLHFSCGVHPWRSSEAEALWPMVVARATDPRVVAIGECGIDRLRGADVQLQTELFRSHALLAEEVGKPLIIHCVRGWAELLAVHRAVAPAVTWIVHGFRGAPALARQLLDAGIHLSLGEHFRSDTAACIPPDMLHFETDTSTLPIEQIKTNITNQSYSQP